MVAFIIQNVAEDKNLAKRGKEMGWLYERQVRSDLYHLMVMALVNI